METPECPELPGQSRSMCEFDWWFTQAEEYLAYARLIIHDSNPCMPLFHVRLAAEFTFKAVTITCMKQVRKTHNNHTLFLQAAQVIPEIKRVFPCDTPAETRIFSMLSPHFTDGTQKPDELEILANRIGHLQSVVRAHFA